MAHEYKMYSLQGRTDPEDFSLTNPITPDEARNVPLPSLIHPIKRLQTLAKIGHASFALKQVGMSPLPMYATRGDLVRVAKSGESARRTMDLLHSLGENRPEEPPADAYDIATNIHLAIEGAKSDQTLRIEQPDQLLRPDDLR